MNRLISWIRAGLRDLRGDLRRFGVLIACLALGTSVIAAVGSVGSGLKGAVDRDAVTLMGGDLELSRPDRDATEAELDYFKSLGQVTHIVDTNAHATANDENAFVDLLAVSDSYPLRGQVVSPQLKPGEKPAVLLGERDGHFGAIVDPVLFDKLGIALGGSFSVGKTSFEVRGILGSLPDGAVRGFSLGVTVVISTEALATMSDLRPPLPGLLTQHHYKLVLSDGLGFEEAAAEVAAKLDDPEWKIRSPRDAAGRLVRYYDLFSSFLLIVGLSSLLVGGVGVSNGVSAYVTERQESIAILRSLGATGLRIVVHFLTQIAVLTAVGVGLGVVAGALASYLLLPIVGQALGVGLPPSIEPVPLLIAAGFGFLSGFAFSYLPLMGARAVSPALLFRSLGATMPRLRWRTLLTSRSLIPLVLAAIGIFVLAVVTTGDLVLVSYYALGVVVSFLLLRLTGLGLQWVLRKMPAFGNVDVRHALRNIYRPGSAAPVVIVSVGLGLAVLLIIALLESNLYNQLLGAVSRDAPTFVATDLFDDEAAVLEDMAKDSPDFVNVSVNPMLRGAIVGINGKPPPSPADLPEESAFLLSGEVPFTWLADLPAHSTVVGGKWWPADYSGPPLVSLRSTMRDELGLKIGDTLQIRLFGQIIDARIANFRDYQWQNGINFMVTFSPGMIEDFPATLLAGIKAAPGKEKTVERALARAFPDVSFIPIGDTLNKVADVLGQLGTAVTIVGGLAVINGLLVLAGTMAAGRKRREADAVIQKVLGATRIGVLKAFVLEYGLLGAFAAIIASIVGNAAAWAITQTTLEVDFVPDPALIAGVILGAIAMTVAAGAATTWRALSTRPAQFLRTVS